MSNNLHNRTNDIKSMFGFTLVELLSVIVILSVVTLIITPVVSNTVKNSKRKAGMVSSSEVYKAAKLYYAKAIIEPTMKAKMTGRINILDELEIKGSKPSRGTVVINSEGYIALALMYDDYCYKKNFNSDDIFIANANETCESELSPYGRDDIAPTIVLSLSNDPFNELDWSRTDVEINVVVNDVGNGPKNFMWCQTSDATCEPNSNYLIPSGVISLSVESSTSKICAIGYDINDNTSEITCTDAYKIDKTGPVFTEMNDLEISKGESLNLATGVSVSDALSGLNGTYSTDPVSVSNSVVATTEVTYTATDNAGNVTNVTRNVIVVNSLYVDASGANYPELHNGSMIPVKYNGTNWIYADVYEEWYDYDNKEWANAVVLNDNVQKNVGDIIDLASDISGMFVWIPRYYYTIFNGNNSNSVGVRPISITFETEDSTSGTVRCTDNISKSDTVSEDCTDTTQQNNLVVDNDSTYTHPAFTFGDTNINGFWIGKFESGILPGSSCYNSQTVANCNDSSLRFRVIPNVVTWRGGTIGTYFNVAFSYASEHNLINADSHAAKNMEWAATTYLAMSTYGRCDSNSCTEVSINNSSSFFTGKSYGAPGDGNTPSVADGSYAYHETEGWTSSTTGNIYGVYDMSGGSNEYIMANMSDTSGNYYANNSTLSTVDPKYYDAYSYSTSDVTHARGKLGDGIKETLKTVGSATGGWFGDNSSFVSGASPWLIRGGSHNNKIPAGLFYYSKDTGAGNPWRSFRLIITIPDP